VGIFFFIEQRSAIAVLHACAAEGVEAKIKWPYDVVVSDGRKVSGITARIDSKMVDGKESFCCFLGVRINVNVDMSKNEAVRDTSISVCHAANRLIDRELFLATYLQNLEQLLQCNKKDLQEMYAQLSVFQTSAHLNVHKNGPENEATPAVMVGFDENLQLQVRYHPHEEVQVLNPEEVSVRSP